MTYARVDRTITYRSITGPRELRHGFPPRRRLEPSALRPLQAAGDSLLRGGLHGDGTSRAGGDAGARREVHHARGRRAPTPGRSARHRLSGALALSWALVGARLPHPRLAGISSLLARHPRSWARRRRGHAGIEETEGTYGHLERERHERRVDLDAVCWAAFRRVPRRPRMWTPGARLTGNDAIFRAKNLWWRVRDSNPRPRRCERRALPTELTPL